MLARMPVWAGMQGLQPRVDLRNCLFSTLTPILRLLYTFLMGCSIRLVAEARNGSGILGAEYSLIRVVESDGQSGVGPWENADRPLDIVVLHTSDASTLRSLKTAASLAAELFGASASCRAAHCPVSSGAGNAAVPVSFTARKLQELASEAGVEVSVDIILCRDLMTTLSFILKPQSLIVMGEHRSRWGAFQWLDRDTGWRSGCASWATRFYPPI